MAWPTSPPIDVALLPIGGWGQSLGPGHLDPQGAADASELIRPEIVVPVHWGTYSPISWQRRPAWLHLPAERFVAAMSASGQRRPRPVLEPGGRLVHPAAAVPLVDGRDRRRRRAAARRATRTTSDRPGRWWYGAAQWSPSSTAATLWVLSAVLDDFSIDGAANAVLAGFVVGLVGAVVWPALAFVVVPISVLTLGLGAIVLEALVVGLVLDLLPGVTLDGFGAALIVTVGLAMVTTVVSSALALDDTAWFDQRMARRARRRHGDATVTDQPGVIFVQLDGVAKVVLERALRAGDVPTLHRWITEGTHRLIGWETGWSSQTGVSQCGILHGSTVDMPAFRWVDKSTGDVVVSNHRKWALALERAHSDGNGLLAYNGSSYGNLFSGDAERAVLTMSGVARRKEGRLGAGYFGYFSRPQQAAKTLIAVLAEIARERRAAGWQRRRGVEPRVDRNWSYALLRSFTTVVSRDVSVEGVINDMFEGRAAIYVDMLGYDEVAHHSGPERADTLAVLRDLDHQIDRIQRTTRWAPRPYRIVVLSDHGQTQGATFVERTGETLADARRPPLR